MEWGKAEVPPGSSPSVAVEMDGLDLGRKREKQLCVWSWIVISAETVMKNARRSPLRRGWPCPAHLCCLRAACSYSPSSHGGSPLISSGVGTGRERNPKSFLWACTAHREGRTWGQQNPWQSVELSRLENSFKIIKPHHPPSTTTKPCPPVAHPQVF